MQQRKTYAKLPLHANFYPVTTQAYLQDANVRLSLLTSQSLGAASFKQGMYEQILRFIPTAYWKILNLNKLEKYVVCYAVVHQELCCTADHFPAIGNVCTSFFFFFWCLFAFSLASCMGQMDGLIIYCFHYSSEVVKSCLPDWGWDKVGCIRCIYGRWYLGNGFP